MTLLSVQMPVDLSPIQQAISMFGIPNPIEYLDRADADPDPIRANGEAVGLVGNEVHAMADDLAQARGSVQWTGPAAISFGDAIDGIIDVLRSIGDALLAVVEFVLQAIDAIVDLFRAILGFLVAAAAIIAAIIIAATAAAVITLGGSLAQAAAAVWAVAKSTLMTVIGLVGTVALILKFILDGTNSLVENVLDGVQGAREALA